MSKNKLPTLRTDRLEEALKDKGMSKIDFGRLCFDFMLRNKLWKKTPSDNKQISNWVSLLCRPEDDPRKGGVNPRLLPWITILLDVRAAWLTGQDDFKTNEDLLDGHIKHTEAKAADLRRQMVSTETAIKGSPVYRLIQDRIEKGSLVLPGTDLYRISFKDDPECSYNISIATLRMMEAACADLCCSLIRNAATGVNCK